jgi:dienelactone hydrolase
MPSASIRVVIIGALVFVPRLLRLFGPGLLAMTLLLGRAAPSGAVEGQPRHLIYLHGYIVQAQQDARPKHPRFGYYELRQIEDALRERGFVVHAEIRPRSASVADSADRVVQQVRHLLDSGVPAHHVSVVGASMGGTIALLASARLQEPEVRFCVLGTCLDESVRRLRANAGRGPIGHVLSIREASDEVVGECPTWSAADESYPGLIAREIMVETGLSHGFLYRPLPEWVEPVVDWAGASGQDDSGHAR